MCKVSQLGPTVCTAISAAPVVSTNDDVSIPTAGALRHAEEKPELLLANLGSQTVKGFRVNKERMASVI